MSKDSYSASEALIFLGVEVNDKNLIRLLKDFKRHKISYCVRDGSNSEHVGFFSDVEYAVKNCNDLSEFVDVNNHSPSENFKIPSKYVNKDKTIKVAAPYDRILKDALDRSKFTALRQGDFCYYVVSLPTIVELQFKNCEFSGLDIVLLFYKSYHAFEKVYKKPVNLPDYEDLIHLAKFASYDDGLRKGVTFERGKVYFNNVFFKVTEQQSSVLKNIWQHFSKKGMPAKNAIAFNGVKSKAKRKQISSILGDIETRNFDSGYSIRDVIKPHNPNKTIGADAAYIVELPDHW